MFHEASPHLWINPGKLMTVVKFIIFIRSCGSIEPSLFVASFFIMFPRSVSSFHPVMVKLFLFQAMEKVRIIRRQDKELRIIRRGVQSNNRVSRGNRNSIWKQIWGIVRSIMWVGLSSMVMGGRFKPGITQSYGKGYWIRHKQSCCCTLSLNFSCPHFPLKLHNIIGAPHLQYPYPIPL